MLAVLSHSPQEFAQMVPDDVVALAKAISLHYTGKEDSWIEHCSTAASFVKKLDLLGYTVTVNPNSTPTAAPTKEA